MAYLSGAHNDLDAHIRTFHDDNGSAWLRASGHPPARYEIDVWTPNAPTLTTWEEDIHAPLVARSPA